MSVATIDFISEMMKRTEEDVRMMLVMRIWNDYLLYRQGYNEWTANVMWRKLTREMVVSCYHKVKLLEREMEGVERMKLEIEGWLSAHPEIK